MKISNKIGVQMMIGILVIGQTLSQCTKNTYSELWTIDKLDSLNNSLTTQQGSPRVKDITGQNSVWFDGIGDGLLVQSNPLEGAESFTIEVIFYPDSINSLDNFEQRFVHIQNPENDDRRILIELRVLDNQMWYLDTFIKSEKSSLALMR
jgi:hypothetical protein